MARREYQGAAPPLSLAAPVGAGDLTVTTTGTVTGWPTGATSPFYVEIDREVAGKAEKLLVTSRSGNTLTVATRGADGTTAVAHTAGAVIEHVLDAGTVDESNAHVNDDTRDDHSQYLTNARHDTPSRHLLGTSIQSGVPGTSAVGDTASEGVSTAAARIDHRHARESFGLVGNISSSEPGDTAIAGTSGKPADANHQHAREAWGLVGDLSSSAPGATALAGTSGKVADANHRHAREAWGTSGDIAASNPGAVASAGSTGKVADAGHVHPRENKPSVAPFSTGVSGDTSVAPNITSGTLVSQAITAPAPRLLIIWGQVNTRQATGDLNYAGNLQLIVDGAVIELSRVHSHAMGGVIPVSIFAMGPVTTGAHTVELKFSNDVTSGGDVIISECELNVYMLGD